MHKTSIFKPTQITIKKKNRRNFKNSPLVLLLLVYTNIVSLVVSSPFRLAANIASPHCSAIFGGCCIAQTCSYLAVVKVWASVLLLTSVSGRLTPTDFGHLSKCFYTQKKEDGWRIVEVKTGIKSRTKTHSLGLQEV